MTEQIGRYEIRGLIGKGGMADVLRAYDPRFQREVAIKMLPAEFLRDAQFRQRFQQEAMTIARLEHPAIVPVYDFGDENDSLFLVMRLMEGGSLQDRLDGNPVALPETARLFNRLAPAMDAVHSKGIVHRDLKPGNILFDEWDEPYLTDFGIVKILTDSEAALTKTGGILGTPAYMSPEQVQGEVLDGRSDIYALGVILYEMLTGAQPFRADTAFSLALKHLSEPVPTIRDANQDLPPGTQVVINHSLAKDRADRYPTARALAAELDALAREDDREMGAVAVVGTGMVAPEEVDSDVTLLDTPPQPQPALAIDGGEKADGKTTASRWAWIAGAALLLMLAAGLFWVFGRGGAGEQPLDEGDARTAVPLAGVIEESGTAVPAPTSTAPPATNTPLPSATPTAVPTVAPTTTPPLTLAAFGGTPLPEGPLAIIRPDNASEIEPLSQLGKGQITEAAYSPDGSILALAASTGIYLYDAQTLQEMSFIPTDTWINSVAFAPDGELLVSGSAADQVQLWRVSDGQLLHTLEGHTDSVNSVAFSTDGQTAASGSADETVRLWRVSDGALLITLEGHTDSVNSVAFAADGETLASGSADETVRLWRASDGAVIFTLVGHTDEVNDVAFYMDGQTLASGSSDETVRLWRVSDGTLLNILDEQNGRVFAVAIAADGETLASGASDGSLLLWRVSDGTLRNTLERNTTAINSLAFSAGGNSLAAGSADSVRLFQVSNGRLRDTLPGHTSWMRSVAFSPDGQTLAAGSANRVLYLWRAADGALLNTLEGHTSIIRSAAFSPNGQTVASGADDYTVRLWRTADGSPLNTLEGHTDSVLSLAFSADGERLASGAEDGSVLLWQAADGQQLTSLEGNADGVTSMAFSPDGELLASGLADGSVLIQQIADGEIRNRLAGHTDRVTSVAFSADGLTLASGSFDAVRLWNVADGATRSTPQGDTASVRSLAFSPDGQTLAGGSFNSIRLWRVADGALLNTLEGHTNFVDSVTFSPNGDLLASGSFDGTIRLWGVAERRSN